MFKTSYKVATVWGIPIKVHISLLLRVIFLVQEAGLLIGILLELGIVVSIVLHELGHSIVAIKKGYRVREITLMFFGGAAQMDQIPAKPMSEFLMAIAGPAVSLVVGAVCLWGGRYLPLSSVYSGWNLNLIQVIGVINFILLFFNLLPSFPMDGGRIFRAMLTPRFGRLRATFIAARLGKIMAILFGISGFISGDWFRVFIAFFVYSLAGNEYRMVQMEEAAKRSDSGNWSPFGNWQEEPSDNSDRVTISPPPYEKGPGSSTDIHSSDEDNPFKQLFK